MRRALAMLLATLFARADQGKLTGDLDALLPVLPTVLVAAGGLVAIGLLVKNGRGAFLFPVATLCLTYLLADVIARPIVLALAGLGGSALNSVPAAQFRAWASIRAPGVWILYLILWGLLWLFGLAVSAILALRALHRSR